jgi:hypothetical protein
MKTLELEKLSNNVTKLSGNQCAYYSEACIVLLEELAHCSGVPMKMNGDTATDYCLTWTSTPNKNGWKATAKLIENAATAIAFFLVAEETDYRVVEEAMIGTGVDYWLGYREDHASFDEDNFMNARLEISGIRNDASAIAHRVKMKLKQTTPTDNTKLPAYVVVAEFGTPTAILTKK